MSATMRWAWAALFMLLAMAAVAVNMNSRRILVVHEGQVDSAYAKAFRRGLDAVLQPVARLKVRHQYMGFDSDACPGILEQMKAFDPDTVVAEGPGARACVQPSARGRLVVFAPRRLEPAAVRARHVMAWQRLLQDLVPAGGTLLVLRTDDAQGRAEYGDLAQAAQAAGLRTLAWTDDGGRQRAALEQALAQAAAPGAVIVGHGAGWSWQDAQENPQGGLLHALREITGLPIVSTRLESLALGADLALAQAPEQRGEMLALAALARQAEPALAAPYEMAVGMRKDFAQRQALPQFYELSARMAGFLAEP